MDSGDAQTRSIVRKPGAPRLAVIGGGMVATHALPAAGEVVIGRDAGCDVRIDDPSLSRRHLRLRIAGTTFGVLRVRATDPDAANLLGAAVRDIDVVGTYAERFAQRAYRWPGNVRELRNAIERATLLCDGMIDVGQLPDDRMSRPAAAAGSASRPTPSSARRSRARSPAPAATRPRPRASSASRGRR